MLVVNEGGERYTLGDVPFFNLPFLPCFVFIALNCSNCSGGYVKTQLDDLVGAECAPTVSVGTVERIRDFKRDAYSCITS
jgi:hypothetical protein